MFFPEKIIWCDIPGCEILTKSAEGLAEYLAERGIDKLFFKREGVWVIADGGMQYEAPREECFYHAEIGESDFLVYENDGKLQVVIDRQEYGKVD